MFTPEIKNRLMIAIFSIIFLGSMNNANLGAFFPLFAQENDWINDKVLTEQEVALIMSFPMLSQVIFSPFVSRIKAKLGTKNTILLGLTLNMLSAVGLGSLSLVKEVTIFKYGSLVCRFIQGAGDKITQITYYCVVT